MLGGSQVYLLLAKGNQRLLSSDKDMFHLYKQMQTHKSTIFIYVDIKEPPIHVRFHVTKYVSKQSNLRHQAHMINLSRG